VGCRSRSDGDREGGLRLRQSTSRCLYGMYHVYILESESKPGETYVGSTGNLERRLTEHRSASDGYTARWKPWQLRVSIAFSSREEAEAFEAYLKTGSGRAFLRRHFVLKPNPPRPVR